MPVQRVHFFYFFLWANASKRWRGSANRSTPIRHVKVDKWVGRREFEKPVFGTHVKTNAIDGFKCAERRARHP